MSSAKTTMSQASKMASAKNKDRSSSPPMKEKKSKSCFKQVMGAMFSQLGIIVFACVFIVGGCFLFQLLEQTTSTELCMRGRDKYEKLKVDHRDWLYSYILINVPMHETVLRSAHINSSNSTVNFTQTYTVDFYNQKYKPIDYNLRLFRDEINQIYRETRYRGQDCEAVSEWTTWSALLFAVTLLTTLGYGHVTPKTWEGQIVCICFSILGIPFILYSVVIVSVSIGNLVRKIYIRLLSCICCFEKNKSPDPATAKSSSAASWNRHVKTVSNRDECNYDNHIEQFYAKQYAGKINMQGRDPLYESDEDDDHVANYLYLNEYVNELSVHRRVKKVVNIPLTITIFIMIGYVALGGLIFSSIEEWTFIRACYFSFTSVATIGFGDIIPGSKNLNTGFAHDDEAKTLGITSIYIIFGMAILGLATELADYEIKKMAHIFRKIFSRDETSQRRALTPDTNTEGALNRPGSSRPLSQQRPASLNRVSPI